MTTAQSAIRSSFKKTQLWPRDPLHYYVEFPLCEDYFPLGFPLEISTNSPDVIAAARQSWGRFPQLQTGGKIHLRVGVAETGRQELPRPPVLRAQRGIITIIADPENFGICDVTAGFSFGWITPAVAADSAFFRYHFLDLMTGMLLAPMHFAIVHSGCVVRDGHGVLLCGDSGEGKSTLSFACAQLGWTFVSDDAVYVPRRNAGREVIGNPLYLKLRPDAPTFFPHLRDRPVVLRQNGEWGFDISTDGLPGFATAFKCDIDHIVFLNRSAAGPAALRDFPKEEARNRLEDVLEYTFACKPSAVGNRNEMFLADPEARQEQKDSITRLLAAGVHELSYSDLDSAIGCLESLIHVGE
jgi:hypothetical protein